MGLSVVFWSPVPGQTGTTSNLVALSALLGLEYSSYLLLFGHLQSRRASLEQALMRRRTQEGDELTHAADTGIDALERLLRNRKLTPAMVRDYTVPLLKDRLDLLPGSNKPDKVFVPGMKDVLPLLLETAGSYYDLVLIDGGSGTGSAWTQTLLQHADLVVVNLNQNRLVLDRFFGHQEADERPGGKKRILLLGQYDCYSSYTAKNIARRYRVKEPLLPVPHNAGWMDATREGRAIDFCFRNRNVPRDHENHFFVQSVRAAAKAVIEWGGLNKPFFGGKGE
mgnify:FL=1